MKKVIQSVAICTLVLVMLVACGGSKSLDGKWGLTGFEMGGADMLALLTGVGGMDPDTLSEMMYCEFKGDKFTIAMDGDEMEGTYKVSGSKITLTIDGEDQVGTLKGDSFTISIDEGGETMAMTFTKK